MVIAQNFIPVEVSYIPMEQQMLFTLIAALGSILQRRSVCYWSELSLRYYCPYLTVFLFFIYI